LESSPLNKAKISAKRKKVAWIILILASCVFILLVILAPVSLIATSIGSENFIPRGIYRLHIDNADGKPIEGATLNLYTYPQQDKGIPIDGYPLPTAAHHLISDSQGIITITNYPTIGAEESDTIGGKVFWLFPLVMGRWMYYCEITARGYKPYRFDIMKLFDAVLDSNGDEPTTIVNLQGYDYKITIYELTIRLHK
jgi:hypothetical protein